jgi:hypothetical protein
VLGDLLHDLRDVDGATAIRRHRARFRSKIGHRRFLDLVRCHRRAGDAGTDAMAVPRPLLPCGRR